MAEIQSRLAYVSCERQLAQVKSGMEKCYHIRPPIDRYATLQFGSFDEIEETGYKHGTDIVSAWVKGLFFLNCHLDNSDSEYSPCKVGNYLLSNF